MTTAGIRVFVRNNSLSLAFFGLFLVVLLAQAFAGLADENRQLVAEGLSRIDFWRYVSSSDFAVNVAENWQSEYLQFFLFILLTVWLVQVGSPESRPPGTEGEESDRDQLVGEHAKPESPAAAKAGGWRAELYGWSLGALMLAIFVGAWAAQAVTGVVAYNAQRLTDLQDPVSLWGYVGSPDFWNRTLQNWQSELLAVASMVVFSIYLRQRGSSESKKVGEAHEETGG